MQIDPYQKQPIGLDEAFGKAATGLVVWLARII
jgi:hypothetical protein